MSAAPDPVTVALAEAARPGIELAPAALLALMQADAKPTSTIDDMDRRNAQYEAVRQDIGFLHACRVTGKTPSDEEQSRLAALMRWLIREVNSWTPGDDPQLQTLASVFAVIRYCDQNNSFWPAFVPSIKINQALVDQLERRTRGLSSQLAASTLSRTPFSDRESIRRFNGADVAGDWATIVSEWPRFCDLLFPDAFIYEGVRYLHNLSPDALRRATDKLRQTVPVMLVLLALTVHEALALACANENPYVQVGSMLRLLQRRRHRQEVLTPAEEALLTLLLRRAASDDSQWEAWMQALNKFPTRYPELQKSIGAALADGPESALRAYVEAINLTTSGLGRDQVAECLRAFRAAASSARRRELWELAHERWLRWDFGLSEQAPHLTGVARCELDYALVGYTVECMDVKAITQKSNDLIARLTALPTEWHASATAYIRNVNSILSYLQPYTLALQLGPDDDWLVEATRLMLPFDPRQDRYRALLYEISVP